MQYAIRNENGEHVRRSRVNRSTRTTDGLYGANRDLEQQKELRRRGAQERAAFRKTLTAEQQLERLENRGPCIRERVRLLAELGTTEAIDTMALILAELLNSRKLVVRKLGRELTARYVS
jgi:hypothetical protein